MAQNLCNNVLVITSSPFMISTTIFQICRNELLIVYQFYVRAIHNDTKTPYSYLTIHMFYR